MIKYLYKINLGVIIFMSTENNNLDSKRQRRIGKYKDYFNNDNDSSSSKNAVLFLVGLVICGLGIFLVFQNTILYTNFSLMDLLGFNPPFGVVLLPLIIGVGILFFNDKSIFGWLLIIFGLITIIAGILMGLKIFFKPVTLYQGLLMFCTITAGVGIMLKAISKQKI